MICVPTGFIGRSHGDFLEQTEACRTRKRVASLVSLHTEQKYPGYMPKMEGASSSL
jgi:hypothetical protein